MMLAKCAASRNPSEEGAPIVPTPEDLFEEAPDVLTEEDLLSDESIFIVNRRSSSNTAALTCSTVNQWTAVRDVIASTVDEDVMVGN